MKKILFVDDEIQVLKAISRVFVDTGYMVWFAQSAAGAMEILGREKIDMIVTDMKMPGTSGVELLKKVKSEYPDVIRAVLSGYSDEREIIFTLQSNLARAYMFKPWNDEELLRLVKQNLDPGETSLPQEVITYINNMDKLPTIGARYQNILEAVREEKDLGYIAGEIEKDQTVTAKLLQLVNSAYFGLKTGSVKSALSCIGTDELKQLVLSLEIMDFLTITGSGRHLAEMIWNHAYITSRIQRIIQEKFLHKKENHTNISAGLLHKIGMVFMLKYYGTDYSSLLGSWKENKDTYLSPLELSRFGYTHSDLSAYLLKSWNAPEPIIEAASYYDAPFNKEVSNHELACVIHIAQHYAGKHEGLNPFCRFIPLVFESLGIDRPAFEENYQRLIEV
ncbi:MAG: HDOD domain-containing protein [Oscillospiraceae bacterium]